MRPPLRVVSATEVPHAGTADGEASTFARRIARSGPDPTRLAQAGMNLVNGALRIRRGGDGVYGTVDRPVTKPIEAVRAWIDSMAREVEEGKPYPRAAELRESVVAAAEEVDAAVREMPAAHRLRGALYEDALGALTTTRPWYAHPAVPWGVAVLLAGVLAGVLIARRR